MEQLFICIFVTTKVEGNEVIQRRDAENAEQDEGEIIFCLSLRFSAYSAPLR